MNDNEKKQNRQKKQKKEPNKITIEVSRFQNLLEILKEPKRVLTLSLAITIVGILLFGGITLIVLSVKRLYPYNDITTNAMGTTTLRSENKDVSYFLLNSAELWANSGIKVTKGQTITIKSSGKKHSAIHHLVDDARSNKPKLKEPWVGAEGFIPGLDPRSERDLERAKYRIFPENNQDVLLLQIVEEGGEKTNRPEGKNRFYVVGKKMEDIHIDIDGTLYFAVNDIVLDDRTIIQMMLECNNNKTDPNGKEFEEIIKKANSVRSSFEQEVGDTLQKHEKEKLKNDEIKKIIDPIYDKKYIAFLDALKMSPKWGGRPVFIADYLNQHNETNEQNTLKLGPCELGLESGKNHIELYGYYMRKYQEAWFEDNVGSFLILVETVND